MGHLVHCHDDKQLGISIRFDDHHSWTLQVAYVDHESAFTTDGSKAVVFSSIARTSTSVNERSHHSGNAGVTVFCGLMVPLGQRFTWVAAPMMGPGDPEQSIAAMVSRSLVEYPRWFGHHIVSVALCSPRQALLLPSLRTASVALLRFVL